MGLDIRRPLHFVVVDKVREFCWANKRAQIVGQIHEANCLILGNSSKLSFINFFTNSDK